MIFSADISTRSLTHSSSDTARPIAARFCKTAYTTLQSAHRVRAQCSLLHSISTVRGPNCSTDHSGVAYCWPQSPRKRNLVGDWRRKLSDDASDDDWYTTRFLDNCTSFYSFCCKVSSTWILPRMKQIHFPLRSSQNFPHHPRPERRTHLPIPIHKFSSFEW